jgi:hypothetical protein
VRPLADAAYIPATRAIGAADGQPRAAAPPKSNVRRNRRRAGSCGNQPSGDRPGGFFLSQDRRRARQDAEGEGRCRSGPGKKAGSKAGPAFNDAATLTELGLSKKRASRARKLAGQAGSLAILRSP